MSSIGPAGQEPSRLFRIDTFDRQFIFSTAQIINSTAQVTGTSFLVNGSTNPNQYVPVLVTNKHVISGASAGYARFLRANEDLTGPALGSEARAHFQETDWTGHPDPEVDIAAVLMGNYFHKKTVEGTPIFHRHVGQDLFANESLLSDLGVMEPIAFVGYPNGLFDMKNMTPIVRRGYTATPIELDYNGKPMFLVDAAVFPGSSGSPVFLVQTGSFQSAGVVTLGQNRVSLLGILAAVHTHSVTGQIIVNDSSSVHVSQVMGLGLVYNTKAISETLDHLFATKGLNRYYLPSASRNNAEE